MFADVSRDSTKLDFFYTQASQENVGLEGKKMRRREKKRKKRGQHGGAGNVYRCAYWCWRWHPYNSTCFSQEQQFWKYAIAEECHAAGGYKKTLESIIVHHPDGGGGVLVAVPFGCLASVAGKLLIVIDVPHSQPTSGHGYRLFSSPWCLLK